MELKNKFLEELYYKFKRNEILNKGTSAFILKIIGSLLGYIFLLLVTRTAGADTWGVFALCLALLNITSIFSRMGIDVATLKFIASFKYELAKTKAVYLKGLKVILPLSVMFSLLLFLLSDFISINIFQKSHLSSFIQLIALAVLPFTLIYFNAQSFRGLKMITHFAFFQHVSKFLFSVVFLFAISYLIGFPVQEGVFYAFIAALYCAMFISFLLIKKQMIAKKEKSPISTHTLLKTAFPMMLSTSILLIMSWADTLIIGVYEDESEIGVYNVAIKLAMISGIVLGALNSIVAPKISEAFNNGKKDEFALIVKQSTKIIFYSSFPILIFLIAFPEFLLSLFGSEFLIGKSALYVLIIGQIVNAFSGSVGVIMQMTGKEKLFQNILILALLTNIVLNFLLVPIYGIIGAAIASSVSLVLWNLISVFYIYKHHHVLTFFNFK